MIDEESDYPDDVYNKARSCVCVQFSIDNIGNILKTDFLALS